MKFQLSIIFYMLFLYCGFVYSQKQQGTLKKIENSIENINRLLGSDCKTSFDEDFIVTFYEKGIPYREDRARLDALNPNTVHYSKEEKSVIVECLNPEGLGKKWEKHYKKGCIGRHISKHNQWGTYSRIAFPVKDEKKTNELKTELEKIIIFGGELTFD